MNTAAQRFLHISFFVLLAVGFATAGLAQESSPAPEDYEVPNRLGFVNDFAGILTPSSVEAMEQRSLETMIKYGGEIVVVTLQSLDGYTSEALATRFVAEWAVGTVADPNGPDPHGGVLLLLAYEERDLSVQVSGEATGLITRAVLNEVVAEEMAPFLRDNDFSSGLYVGVQGIAAMFEARFGDVP